MQTQNRTIQGGRLSQWMLKTITHKKKQKQKKPTGPSGEREKQENKERLKGERM